MIKNLFIFICIYLPVICFGQSRQLVDSINKVIGPTYLLKADSSHKYHNYNSFFEVDLTGDGVKEIVLAAGKADSEDSNKIFVFQRKGRQLQIFDSSPPYEVDGHGPSTSVRGSQLTITHGFSHGSNSITYDFDKKSHIYRLVALYNIVGNPRAPDENHILDFQQEYDVKTGILALNTSITNYTTDKVDGKKQMKVLQKLPADISLNLSEMKDPYGYDDVFLTEGPVYEAMMKY